MSCQLERQRVVEEGEDITIITWGAMVRDAQKAREDGEGKRN